MENKDYNMDTTGANTYVHLQDAAYLHTTTAGAWLPLQRSLISGAIVGALTLVVTVRYLPDDWLFLTILLAVATTGLTWLFFQKQWARLVSLAERITGADLNADGMIADETPTETTHRITVDLRVITKESDITHRASFAGISDERMALFARGLLAGRSPSVGEWTGKGKPFSRRELEKMVGEMYRRKILAYANPKNPNDGYWPTTAGWAALRHLANAAPTPPGSPDAGQ